VDADRAALRRDPSLLVPGVQRIISLRMDYLPPDSADPWRILDDPARAYVSRYALGRDYHKLLRRRIQQLANRIEAEIGPFGYRAFTDSAPVLEKALAEQAGLGWIGKHTNLLAREAGSWFFLGELFTDLPLPVDDRVEAHCGSCTACLDICPTRAFRGPYDLDARRCISYLTIEHQGAIPEPLRPLMGNRIYGCDDCQLVCPWNRFAEVSVEPDFAVRHGVDAASLIELFDWDEPAFLDRTAGMAIRRIGHRALAAQYRGGARKRPVKRRGPRRAGTALRPPVPAGARARGMGPATAHCRTQARRGMKRFPGPGRGTP
jgi:epoxyqueuosine reductase